MLVIIDTMRDISQHHTYTTHGDTLTWTHSYMDTLLHVQYQLTYQNSGVNLEVLSLKVTNSESELCNIYNVHVHVYAYHNACKFNSCFNETLSSLLTPFAELYTHCPADSH